MSELKFNFHNLKFSFLFLLCPFPVYADTYYQVKLFSDESPLQMVVEIPA